MSTPTLIQQARAVLCHHAGGWPLRKNCEKCGETLDNDARISPAEPLAAFALAFAEALPGLYRTKHEITFGVHGPETCDAAAGGRNCPCGLKEHNATLDALADKLGIPVEQRRPR